jgi:tRNA dimethylallyltransferase
MEILEKVKTFVEKSPDGVIEILGPTASGKTGFSIEVATFLQENCGKNVEIISADSRQIYRHTDISSAKISEKKMNGIPHHGLDLIDPDEKMTVFNFQKFAFEKIEEIQNRGNFPILCGGTMLWLDAVSENYIFGENSAEKSVARGEPKWSFLKIGIEWNREKLYERLNARATQQFENGLVEETQKILEKFKLSHNARTSFGYEEIEEFLAGKISRSDAIEKNQKRNRNYAKRQLTWWRGREDIFWLDGESR